MPASRASKADTAARLPPALSPATAIRLGSPSTHPLSWRPTNNGEDIVYRSGKFVLWSQPIVQKRLWPACPWRDDDRWHRMTQPTRQHDLHRASTRQPAAVPLRGVDLTGIRQTIYFVAFNAMNSIGSHRGLGLSPGTAHALLAVSSWNSGLLDFSIRPSTVSTCAWTGIVFASGRAAHSDMSIYSGNARPK